MKKRILVTTMALAMAFAATMGSMGTLTVHAAGIPTDDGCDHGDGRAPGGGGDVSWGTSGSNSSSNSNSGSNSGSGSSNSGGGSSSNTNYDDGADHGDGREPGGGGDIIWSTSTSATKAAGSTTGVTGKEQFHALANSGSGTYKVTHKGVEIATFKLMNADKKNVSCTKVSLKQREDKKWAVNYEVTDATDLTVGAPLDRTYMYNTLGVSYVTINDTVVIDIEAEAQAVAVK